MRLSRVLHIFARQKLAASICIVLLSGAAKSGVPQRNDDRPARTVMVAAATQSTLNQRLATLATLHYQIVDFQAWVADGQLAVLYAGLKSQLQWTQSLQPFLTDKTLAKSAAANLQRWLDEIQGFYIHYVNQSYLGDQAAYDHPDVIVILGANRRTLEQRLVFALPLMRRFSTIPVVLSGGGRTVELEAGVMRDFLTGHGIDADRFVLETDSLDTVGNAVFTSFALARRSLPGDKILLITSNFHAPRSLFLFQKIMDSRFRLAVALAPYDGADLAARIDSELRQQATSTTELLRWEPVPGQSDASNQSVKGTCGVFFQMLSRHKLYVSRWDLARRYDEVCRLEP